MLDLEFVYLSICDFCFVGIWMLSAYHELAVTENICSLETWYFMSLVLFAGYLKNAEVAVDALSIW